MNPNNILYRIPILRNFLNDGAKIESNAKDKKKRVAHELRRVRELGYETDQEALETAIILAEDSSNPNRYLLILIYNQVMRDFHLKSQISTAIKKVLKEKWVIVDEKTKKVDEDATKLFQKKWFIDLCKYQLEAEFWGHSLIEMGKLVMDEEIGNFVFEDVNLIWREHVAPEMGWIKINPNATEGIPFREAPYKTWFIEAGNPNDLGLIHIAARYSIFKKFNWGDWSSSNEKQDDPISILKTASQDTTENDKKENWLKNIRRNSYAMFDDDDELELVDRKTGKGSHLAFKDLNTALDAENSKGINGQVATADEKSFVGSAEVQERILDDYTEARLSELFFYINEKVWPWLIQANNGNTAYSNLKDKKWIPVSFLPLEMQNELKPKTKTSDQEEGDQSEGGAPAKKPQGRPVNLKIPSVM